MSTQNPTPDYAGLSKQEVAERLKNPTPDATATPITDAAACFPACNDSSDDMNPKGTYVDVDVARSLEKQLTAAKAEICELNAWKTGKKGIEDHYREVGELQSDNAALRAEVERLKHHLNRLSAWAHQDPTGPWNVYKVREWVINEIRAALDLDQKTTDWQPSYIELTAECDQLRARVADLENDLEKSKHEADDWHRAWETVTEQAKKEVAELEQDKARLDWLIDKGKWFNPQRHVDGYDRITRAALSAAKE